MMTRTGGRDEDKGENRKGEEERPCWISFIPLSVNSYSTPSHVCNHSLAQNIENSSFFMNLFPSPILLMRERKRKRKRMKMKKKEEESTISFLREGEGGEGEGLTFSSSGDNLYVFILKVVLYLLWMCLR